MNGTSRPGGRPTTPTKSQNTSIAASTNIEARARRYARDTAVLRRWERALEVEKLRGILIEEAGDRRGRRYRLAAADLDGLFVADACRRLRDPAIVRLRRESRVGGAA